jgi:hypothetical protein
MHSYCFGKVQQWVIAGLFLSVFVIPFFFCLFVKNFGCHNNAGKEFANRKAGHPKFNV